MGLPEKRSWTGKQHPSPAELQDYNCHQGSQPSSMTCPGAGQRWCTGVRGQSCAGRVFQQEEV